MPFSNQLHPRSVRNNNPGNLRVNHASPWHGQIGVDNNPGGPFAIFGKAADGFDALATLLLIYQNVHSCHTIDAIFDRYAPPVENNTLAYKESVAKSLGITLTCPIKLSDFHTQVALTSAIAKVEAGAGQWWQPADQTAGITAALARAGRHA